MHISDYITLYLHGQYQYIKLSVSFGVVTHFEPDAGLAEEVVLWHRAVLEDDVAGGGGADAELVLLLAERESWRAIQ